MMLEMVMPVLLKCGKCEYTFTHMIEFPKKHKGKMTIVVCKHCKAKYRVDLLVRQND